MQKQINKTKKSSKKGTKTAAKSGSAKKTGRKAGTSKMQNQPHSMRRKIDCQKEKGKEQQNKTEKSASVYSCPVNYYRAFSWMDRAESCWGKWMEYWGFLHNSDDMVSDTEQSETSSGDDSSGGPEQWQKEEHLILMWNCSHQMSIPDHRFLSKV